MQLSSFFNETFFHNVDKYTLFFNFIVKSRNVKSRRINMKRNTRLPIFYYTFDDMLMNHQYIIYHFYNDDSLIFFQKVFSIKNVLQ